MVRLFQIYNFLARNGWHEQYSSRLQLLEEVKTETALELIHITTGHGRTVCRKTHHSHPLGIFYGDNPLNFSFSLIMIEIILIILISRIVRFILKPLKQPKVVSEIIGGLFIGPSILSQSKTFRENVFPDNAQYVVANLGMIGFMFFMFLAGVKMDFATIRKSGRKHVFLAVLGSVIPIAAVTAVGYMFQSSITGDLARFSGITAVAESLAITSFPVIYLVLKELNLLSSEVGRMALSTTMISDAVGIFFMILFEGIKQGESNIWSAVWFVISMIVLGSFVVIVIRRLLHWIIKKTPEGKPVEQRYVVLILLGVLVMGFLTDMFGVAIGNGSFWLGLVIPDGPPLGATLVERSETIVMEIMMPFAFALVGMYTNVFIFADFGWSTLAPVFAMFMTGYLSKLLVTLAVALYFEMSLKDSLTLSFVMNLRGQTELLIYLHWVEKKLLEPHGFTMIVILATLMTGISGNLISTLYDPTRPYMATKRRTMQHTPAGAELGILVCIHDEECVAGLINLLENAYPTLCSPFSVYAVHLIELVGRAAPVFIDHDQSDKGIASRYTEHENIHHALKLYQDARQDVVKLQSFTILTAKRTMYQDICELALTKKVTLIILPFRKETLDNLAGTEIVRHGRAMQSLNSNVLAHSPCSVGILVDKGRSHNPVIPHYSFQSMHKCVILFLGGADSREALAFADRMARNPDISIMVVRFLSQHNAGDDEIEKKLDDGMVTRFWVRNEANERVVYREAVVKNGEEVLTAIWALNDNSNDLWIVGRKQGINPMLLQGLSKWSENPDLGVIGDFVSSEDFSSSASVLVMHQQITRG